MHVIRDGGTLSCKTMVPSVTSFCLEVMIGSIQFAAHSGSVGELVHTNWIWNAHTCVEICEVTCDKLNDSELVFLSICGIIVSPK